MHWVELPHIFLGGQRVATASRAELTEAMARDCRASRTTRGSTPRLVFSTNGQGISLRHSSSGYQADMDKADVVHADGGFLVTASRWLAHLPIAERSATTDLIHDFAARAQDEGLSFFLLGGTEPINSEAADKLRELYPRLAIVGRHHGYFDAQHEAAVIEEINKARPDILWVGLGKPREQRFCALNRTRLRAGWVVTCGGCFNFIAGDYRRAPLWMQRANLEWVHRMLTRPRQLFWRYLVTTPHALWVVFARSGPL
jgi:exopolysaccharide biosynthesis WecB/TagA/CpsF family protein